MLRLSKATHDQLEMLLCVIDRAPNCVQVRTIGEALGLTPQNALKHASRLVHAGLLRTKRGPGGGVMLAVPATGMNLGAAIRQLEAMNTSATNVTGSQRMRSVSFMSEALSQFIDLLDDFTIADLASGRSPKPAHLFASRSRAGGKSKLKASKMAL